MLGSNGQRSGGRPHNLSALGRHSFTTKSLYTERRADNRVRGVAVESDHNAHLSDVTNQTVTPSRSHSGRTASHWPSLSLSVIICGQLMSTGWWRSHGGHVVTGHRVSLVVVSGIPGVVRAYYEPRTTTVSATWPRQLRRQRQQRQRQQQRFWSLSHILALYKLDHYYFYYYYSH